MSDNLFVGAGLLTRFEEKKTPNGNRVCAFSILLPEAPKKDGSHKKEGTFVPVESWDVTPQLAALLAKNVKKCRVFVRGRLKLDYWQDANTGANRNQLKVIADVVNFQPLKQQRSNNPGGQPGAQSRQTPATVGAGAGNQQQVDADGNPIPF